MDRDDYNLCFISGKKHIDSARIMADIKNYGTAVTLLILGLEELIKYLVIQTALSDKTRFSESEINKVFSDHTTKHKIIIEFLESTKQNFGEKFRFSIFNKSNNNISSNELREIQENRFKEFGSMVGVIENSLTENEIDLFIEWLNNHANNDKNNGLYVNRNDKSKSINQTKLVSPTNIGKSDYEFILKFADSFLNQAIFSKDIDMTDEEFMEFLTSDIE